MLLRAEYHISIMLTCPYQFSLLRCFYRNLAFALHRCNVISQQIELFCSQLLKHCLIMRVKYTSLHSLTYHFNLLFPYSKSLKKESRFSLNLSQALNKLARRTASLSPFETNMGVELTSLPTSALHFSLPNASKQTSLKPYRAFNVYMEDRTELISSIAPLPPL